MQFFILAAAAVALAGMAWQAWAVNRTHQPPQEEDIPALRPEDAAAAAERLGEVVNALRAVMDHPQLGGPGSLTIQFPQQLYAGCFPTVTAQFPNINEALYRRAVRQELGQEELMAAGVPERLFQHNPTFSAESGGVVLVCAEVYGLAPALEKQMADRQGRSQALAALAEALRQRYPEMSVRGFGADLLLSPVRTAEREPGGVETE